MNRTIRRNVKLFGILVAASVVISACACPICIFYEPGVGWAGTPEPEPTPQEAALIKAFERSRQAEVDISEGRYRHAERVLKEAIRLYENALGRESTSPVRPLTNLTKLYILTDRSTEAVKLILKRPRDRKAVLRALKSRSPFPDGDQEKWDVTTHTFKIELFIEAEAEYKRALQAEEKAVGLEHWNLVPALVNLVAIYLEQKEYAEAETAYLRLLTIREKALGPEHPDVVSTLNNLVSVYLAQSKYDEVESIYKRLISIKESSLGAEHPDVAEAHSTLVRFYHAQGRYDEVEPIYKLRLTTHEKTGARREIVESLDRLAQLYDDQGRQALAEEFRNRSWELSSPYCYRPASNAMIAIAPKWAECHAGTVFATRSEYEEWKASKETYSERFRRREAAE